MSDAPKPYSPLYIQWWSALSLVLGLVLFVMFVCGDSLLEVGHVIWLVLRYICRPII